ncbi:MAG TPA: exodeoxyribonuclease VII large subunit [Clostridia bacterium]|nr:exodeoxyribonuclease VII large subunit [Clostridia bacterium]
MNRLSVSQLNMLISRELALSPRLNKVEVEAEIGRLTRHGSGHYYFTIKDHYASIDCVMYRSSVEKNSYNFEEGDRVLLKGNVSFYEKSGRLQFYVQSVKALGEGELLKAFYALKEKFLAQGLLDPLNKKPLPPYPENIAILTSPTGAAYKDFMKIFALRNPFCKVTLYPVAVQGDKAVESIIEALKIAQADLIVLTRGGGSYEDLSVFNDERLCLQIAEHSTPCLCAIGHEIDFTLAELVSDQRAATPSQAAQLATEDMIGLLDSLKSKLDLHAKNRFVELEKQSFYIESKIDKMRRYFEQRLINEHRTLFDYQKNLQDSFQGIFEKEKEKTKLSFLKIESYNPDKILEKGYIAIKQDHWIVRKDNLLPGPAELYFYDGIKKVEIK